MTDEELQEMIDEADRDGDGEARRAEETKQNWQFLLIFGGVVLDCLKAAFLRLTNE